MFTRALVVVLAFAVAPSAAAEVDPYLPSDSDFVLTIQSRSLLAAPLMKQLLPPDLPKALDGSRLGLLPLLVLDARYKFDGVLLTGPSAELEKRWLVVARGRFDTAKTRIGIIQRLQAEPESVKLERKGDFRIYELRETPGGPLFACFLDDTTFALSPSRAQIDGCLAHKEGIRKEAVAKELQRVIEQQKAQTIWFAGLASPALKQVLGTSPETKKVFDNLEHFRGGVDVGTGIDGEITIVTKNGPTADEVRKFLEGVKAILSLTALDRQHEGQRLTDLVAALRLLSVKETVTVRISLSKEQIEKALGAKP